MRFSSLPDGKDRELPARRNTAAANGFDSSVRRPAPGTRLAAGWIEAAFSADDKAPPSRFRVDRTANDIGACVRL